MLHLGNFDSGASQLSNPSFVTANFFWWSGLVPLSFVQNEPTSLLSSSLMTADACSQYYAPITLFPPPQLVLSPLRVPACCRNSFPVRRARARPLSKQVLSQKGFFFFIVAICCHHNRARGRRVPSGARVQCSRRWKITALVEGGIGGIGPFSFDPSEKFRASMSLLPKRTKERTRTAFLFYPIYFSVFRFVCLSFWVPFGA